MVTNMLCFFVLMMAMSNTDVDKFQQLADAFQSLLGGTRFVLTGSQSVLPYPRPPATSGNTGNEAGSQEESVETTSPNIIVETPYPTEEEFALIMQILEEAGVSEQAELRVNERGLLVRLSSSLLFQSESDELLLEARAIIDQIVPSLLEIDNVLFIEGHTCDLPPVGSHFTDNWALSSARAAAVVRYLESRGIASERLIPSYYSRYRPIVPNINENNRQMNRRVDIVIASNRIP